MNTSSGVQTFGWNLLATDYDNWAVHYSCSEMFWDGMHWEYWSILSKDGASISAEDYAAAEASIYANVPNTDINWWTKHSTSHSGCTYNWSYA